YPFQAEDCDYLEDRKSVLLAWEMGTGKTYAAIELDLRHRLERTQDDLRALPTLVVAPLSTLASVWEMHFNELTSLTTFVIDPKNRPAFIRAVLDPSQPYDVYICHWEALRLLITDENFRRFMWGHIIADEVHRAKSRKAQQTRALKAMRTQFRTALSGTPVTNKPYDLWSILNWMYPQQYRSFWRFYNRYCDYEIQYPHGYHKFNGPKNEDELLEQIAPFYRRHLKQERCCDRHPEGVQPELPEKYYTDIWVELSPKQRTAYDQMRKDMIAWLEDQDETKPLVAPVAIAQLVRLQQFAVAYATITYEPGVGTVSTVKLTEPSSKLDVLLQLIEDNEGEQIVVFSQFRQVIDLAAERLRRAKVSFVTITGDVPASERPAAIASFQSGDSQIFLGTIGAGGEGITLTAASTVIFLDRDWSPAKNSQAEDRLHRIGQTNAVQVIDLMARDTVDLGKRQKLIMKRDWMRRILGDV
ncbi:MAG: DEAD/DEAH box helicase, partial [Dehalococcoidales bacterium]